MKNSYKKKREQGFTIIEVLIVLAIAGLIILIVFLAVPALQRNSRNTQRKEDAGKILSGVKEWAVNNGNKYPTLGTAAPGPVEQAAAKSNSNTKLAFYKDANITYIAAAGSVTNATTKDTAVIAPDSTCSGANVVTSSNQEVALMYSLETGGVTQLVCQSL